jgi:hypothetical protein
MKGKQDSVTIVYSIVSGLALLYAASTIDKQVAIKPIALTL